MRTNPRGTITKMNAITPYRELDDASHHGLGQILTMIQQPEQWLIRSRTLL